MKKQLLSHLYLFGILFFGLTALYFPTLNAGPLVDDYPWLLQAKLHGPLFTGHGIFWRPAVSVFFKTEWIVFGLHTVGYHVVSIALCALTALAIAGTIFELTAHRTVSVVSALIFVCWPAHAEVIVPIDCQTDGLAVCFAAFAIWVFVCDWKSEPDAQSFWRLPLWIGLITAALISKESMVVLPLIMVLFAIMLSRSGHGRSRVRLIGCAAAMAALTVAYLYARSVSIGVPILGGAYASGTQHGVISGILNGFNSYHLNMNLLNTFAPLSNRLVRNPLPEDIVVNGLLMFGSGVLAWMFPRSQSNLSLPWYWAASSIFATLGLGLLSVFGSYPLDVAYEIFANPSASGALLGVVVISFVYARYKRWHPRIGTSSFWNCFAQICSTCLAVVIVARGGISNELFFAFLVSYSITTFLTRPNRMSSPEDIERSRSITVTFLLLAVSLVALIPALTIKEVDANLSVSRLSYFATAFSVPAIALILWTVIRKPAVRVIAAAACCLTLVISTIPIVKVWAHSGVLSKEFVEEVQHSHAPRLYVLVSPAVVTSATSLVLGGDRLTEVGNIYREGEIDVIPGYLIDGLTEGDKVRVTPVGPAKWRVEVEAGPCKYRSGRLSIVSCFPPNAGQNPYHENAVEGNSRTADISISGLSSQDEVDSVTPDGVVHL